MGEGSCHHGAETGNVNWSSFPVLRAYCSDSMVSSSLRVSSDMAILGLESQSKSCQCLDVYLFS